ncbi:MAG: DsrE family protein [Planctomycetota bacterium]
MTTLTQRCMQFVLTSGARDPGRAQLGLEAALAAVERGLAVSVYLTLDAVAWAAEPRRYVGGAQVYARLDALRERGCRLHCCTAVPGATDGIGAPAPAQTTAGVQLTPLPELLARVVDGVPTVTF